ncbi:hypothetical protein [Dietzia sp. 179-F 9C3 NHS]|uniref:DUF7241 domain-containing protein n=1 Tax=Dietzia sp. 179-F 9C3 NHS TaxID=3374295 RepID=UPI00387A779E
MSQPARTSAALCRARHWWPGTVLTAHHDGTTTTIVITAVGDTHVLARRLHHRGHDLEDVETVWDLRTHPWSTTTQDAAIA